MNPNIKTALNLIKTALVGKTSTKPAVKSKYLRPLFAGVQG